jgi:hypothetical protein
VAELRQLYGYRSQSLELLIIWHYGSGHQGKCGASNGLPAHVLVSQGGRRFNS